MNLLTIWDPSGIENYFQEAAQAILDPSNPPPLDSETHKKLFVSLAPKYGISQSSYLEQYVLKVDNKIPAAILRDNHDQELLKLLSPDVAKS